MKKVSRERNMSSFRAASRNALYIATGERIRSVRLSRGLSVREVAVITGAHPDKVSGIERGDDPCPVWLLMALSVELNEPIDSLVPILTK